MARPATKQDRDAAWAEIDRLLAMLPESLALSAREMAKELRKACEEREAELGGLLAKAAWYLRHNYVSGRDVETEASNAGREILAALGAESVPDPGARHG